MVRIRANQEKSKFIGALLAGSQPVNTLCSDVTLF